jgi:hypothetical protein
MYWNNPLIELRWPSSRDPIVESQHNGTHCLLWNPAATFNKVVTQQRLIDLCNWANNWLETDGINGFVADVRNHYDIANLVKLNMWIKSMREQGIIKPWLLLDQGDGTFIAGTGDSRMRCLERMPEITTVPAFISTMTNRKHLYPALEEITTFDRFAEICGAVNKQEFLFRLTDAEAPYGLYWYEYNSERTRSVTPGEAEAVAMFSNYARSNPNTKISPEWFDLTIAWEHHKSSS